MTLKACRQTVLWLENMDSNQVTSESAQMGDIIDDEFEITLESPRQQIPTDDQDNNILKLIQAVDHTQNADEKIDIPTIVVTDINNSEGGQIESTESATREDEGDSDAFTAIVDGNVEINSGESDTKDDQTEFTDLADNHKTGTADINYGEVANSGDSTVTQESVTAAVKIDSGLVEIGIKAVNGDSEGKEATRPDNQQESGKVGDSEAENESKGNQDKTVEIELVEAIDDSAGNHTKSAVQSAMVTELEEGSVSLDSILVREKTEEDSDPDEFDFDLPVKKTQAGAEKQVTFKEAEPEPVPAQQQSAIKTDDSEDSQKIAVMVTNQDQPKIIPGNKPVAVIKPTTQTNAAGTQSKYSVGEPSASGSVEEQRNQRVLASAQAEWDKVTTITAGFSDKGTAQGPEPTVVETTPAMSPHEMTEYLKTEDFSQIKGTIHTSIERKGFSAFVHMIFGPPKLNRALLQERDMIFCTAASPLSNDNSYHIRTLQTIYRCLTGSKFDCPRTGSHWEEIGFQGNDPATDLRGAGLLGLVNLLYFLKDPKRQGIASDIYRLSLHPTQNFPFCVMGINMSRITLQTLREDILNKECNRRGEVLGVINDFYVGLYLQMYQVWKSQGKSIQDSGYVIKDIEANAKKNPRSVLKNLDDYINKKKTVVIAEKSADSGADNFLSLCEDDAKR